MMPRILIVDDDAAQRHIITSICRSEGHEIQEAQDAEQALALIDSFSPQVVLTDLRMPGGGGLSLLENIGAKKDAPELIVMTAYSSIETAVKAIRLGAYDYLTKPLDRQELLLVIGRALEKQALKTQKQRLQSELLERNSTGLVTESQAMKEIVAKVKLIAQSNATVLLRGESGTGKERIAHLIHYSGPRAGQPFIGINCAAIPESLMESELFGYEKGSFTGALGRKIGVFEAAHSGTLFLDEVADLSPSAQAKVLRVLQNKEIRRVGGVDNILVDVRIIAATNQNLEEKIRQNLFREDLFYRLNIIPLVIPPLRERRIDIVALVNFHLKKHGELRQIQPEALGLLKDYGWPGNVRELEAVLERILVLSNGATIAVNDLPPEIACRRQSADAIPEAGFMIPREGLNLERLEMDILRQALELNRGNMAEAAKLLGLTYRTFQYRAHKFGLVSD
jgi:DNA-binding NtrC family response regulator